MKTVCHIVGPVTLLVNQLDTIFTMQEDVNDHETTKVPGSGCTHS